MPVGLLFLISCDEDCPTCPQPNPPEEIFSDYNVILGDSDQPFLVFNTKTRTIMDVIDMENMSGLQSMAVGGDGRHLLISRDGQDWRGILVYDLETGDTITKLNFVANIQVSNSGEYVACNTWGLWMVPGIAISVEYRR
jgi:hypothetical protein